MANSENQPNTADMFRHRRSSFTSATFSSLFPRSHSVSGGTPVFPGPIASAAMNDQNRRRRLSISTASALGLSGTSPISPAGAGAGSGSGLRRASLSTNSSASDAAVDESAIEEDDVAPGASRSSPNTPHARRTSFGAQAMRGLHRSGGSVGANSNDQGYSWPEQFRSRAESSVAAGSRASFSFASSLGSSPPRSGGFSFHGFGAGGAGAGAGAGAGGGVGDIRHDRSKSVSDAQTTAVPAAAQPTPPRPRQQPRPKPDHFQERILKGDFYMD